MGEKRSSLAPLALQPLALSAGDPSGVGPVVTADAIAACQKGERFVVFGDADQLGTLLRERRVEFTQAKSSSYLREAVAATFDTPGLGLLRTSGPRSGVLLVDLGCMPLSVQQAYGPTPLGGALQFKALHGAAELVRSGVARAIVTAPVSKYAIASSGQAFVGHTEYLAELDGVPKDGVSMLFMGPKLRVGLVTTHIPIARVPEALTVARVSRTIVHLAEASSRVLGHAPHVVIAGLNPHAGERGMFGDEETRVLEPAIQEATAELVRRGVEAKLSGPTPAETVFRRAAAGDFDAVVAMYHDQATIPSKLLDFGDAVNVTWGLSFVRTSVDHGVAYDAAKAGTAEPSGMIAAVRMAQKLTLSLAPGESKR